MTNVEEGGPFVIGRDNGLFPAELETTQLNMLPNYHNETRSQQKHAQTRNVLDQRVKGNQCFFQLVFYFYFLFKLYVVKLLKNIFTKLQNSSSSNNCAVAVTAPRRCA